MRNRLFVMIVCARSARGRRAAERAPPGGSTTPRFSRSSTRPIRRTSSPGGSAAKYGPRRRTFARWARMVATDHVAVQQMGRDLAKKLELMPTPPDNDTQRGGLRQGVVALLQSKSGAEFDRAYLQHEVAFHQSVVDAIKGTLLPAVRNPELRSLMNDGVAGVRAPSRRDEGGRHEDGREVSGVSTWRLRSLRRHQRRQSVQRLVRRQPGRCWPAGFATSNAARARRSWQRDSACRAPMSCSAGSCGCSRSHPTATKPRSTSSIRTRPASWR